MLTPKQKERLKNKIKKIKAGLTADKKHWGGQYHDGQGLRYLPPALYVQIEEYTGGLRYFNWFHKHFPTDGAYSIFFFEWSIVLFKTKRREQAEKKVFQTYCNNTYFFDVFFGKSINTIKKWEGSYIENASHIQENLPYHSDQSTLIDYADWLDNFITSDKFLEASDRFVTLQIELEAEEKSEKRGLLLDQIGALRNNFL